MPRGACKIGKVAFNKDLRVEASARRFNHRGVFVTTFIYAMNFFAMALLKRPAKFAFRDIR